MKWLIISIALIINTTECFAQNLNNQLPKTNQLIIEYVESVMGTCVASGECWDLAAGALSYAKASWNGAYEFGNSYIPGKTNILPGDILQFENVEAEYSDDKFIYTLEFQHHSAIVYRVLENNMLEIAHQNTSNKRIVSVSKFNPDWVIKGTIYYYRPQK